VSIAADIAAGVQAVVAGLDPDTPTRARKFPGFLDGDPFPVTVVSVTRDAATKADFDSDFVEYTAAVARVEKTQGRAADSAAALAWLERVRARLHDPAAPGVAAVVTAAVDPNEPFDKAAAGSGNNVTSLAVRYTTHEARG
jgi:hypothetical protein